MKIKYLKDLKHPLDSHKKDEMKEREEKLSLNEETGASPLAVLSEPAHESSRAASCRGSLAPGGGTSTDASPPSKVKHKDTG